MAEKKLPYVKTGPIPPTAKRTSFIVLHIFTPQIIDIQSITITMPVIGAKSGSIAGPSQHKQPSRKGRKAWRKNVDVSEVEKGLEERNDQIIKG